jgi:hypothetical protein
MDARRAVIIGTVICFSAVIAVPAFIGGFRETWIDAAAGIALGLGAIIARMRTR